MHFKKKKNVYLMLLVWQCYLGIILDMNYHMEAFLIDIDLAAY